MKGAAAFELATAGRIVFGDGVIARLPALVRALVSEAPDTRTVRALVVTGRNVGRHGSIVRALADAGIELTSVVVRGEPTTTVAREATATARAARVEVVIAIGGGSALDLGKAVAALAPNGGDPLDYLEVVGKGQPLARPPLPFVAVPTTAGTGSEVTKNAVLADPATKVKVSLRSDAMLPRIALVDPELTWSVPADVTAATGMDALVQVIEPFLSHAATPLTDALVRDAIPRGAAAIRRVVADGQDRDARRDMALVSLVGGIALANAKLGAVHGFAGPLGGALEAPHGAICARLLGPVLDANLRALRARAPGSEVLARHDELARLLTGRTDACADDAARWAETLAADLAIPTLSTYGMRTADVAGIAERSARASSMRGNPIVLTAAELEAVLERGL